MRGGGFRTGTSRARPVRYCGRARRRLAALLPLAAAALLPAALAQSAGVSIGATSLSLTEGGTATYTVVLDIAPAASWRSLLEVIPEALHLRCVSRWLPREIAAGVSDPEVLGACAAENIAVGKTA